MVGCSQSGLIRSAVLLTLLVVGSLQAATKPNIIFILVDDMGWSDIGPYGGEIRTPNLDTLAEEGLRFTQFHNTAKCFPSRATLLTGLYAQQAGMNSNPGSMKNSVTLAEVLRGAGYRTLMVGKHHGTDNPVDFGFDHYYGLRDGAANHFNPGFQREGEAMPIQKNYAERTWCFDHLCKKPWTPPDKDFYSTDYYTRWAIEFLDKYESEDKPYFLYLSYQAPHDPLQAWPEDIDRYREVYKVGYEEIAQGRSKRQRESGLIDENWPPAKPDHRPWDSLSDKEQEEEALRMAIYAAMIDRVDQNLGKLFAKVEAMGEKDNTMIFFASDNGSSAETTGKTGSGPRGSISRWTSLRGDWANVSNTPYRYFKNFSHQGGIATPLIVHWPEVIDQPGTKTDLPGHFVDIMATLVDITGAVYPPANSAALERGEEIPPLPGASLLPLLSGQQKLERDQPIFWQWQNGRAVRDGRWKLVSLRVPKSKEILPWELYDMNKDRTETNNLAATRPDVVAHMAAQYETWLSEVTASSK